MSTNATQMAAKLCDELDPILGGMVEALGVELTCCVLHGLCRRIEKRAREAGMWNDARYAAMLKMEKIAEELALAMARAKETDG